MGRVPVSSTDFSTRQYSYDDVKDDFKLEHFALADEDHKYKVSRKCFIIGLLIWSSVQASLLQ